MPEESELVRGLKERHLQLIALGGAIGVGLFLGSARAIHLAGPALTISYLVGGLVIFLIMRALGELALYKPVAGSFSTYAEEFVGPWAGFITGWTYWFMWITTAMAEITAVGVYVRYWFPAVPQWLPALIALVIMFLVNLIAVGAYGEFEFWFALIKVVTIVAMIVVGLLIILFGVWNHGEPVGFSNLWSHGGFFPTGISGVLLALQMVMFAYVGVELIGVTAGEARDPSKTIPAATNKIIWRILIFYVGALLIIMSLYPWNELDAQNSPFVLTFQRIGFPAAADLINFVVLTAALSSCNSGVFSTGRMLYSLAQYGQAPRFLQGLSSRRVPATAIAASAAVMLVGVILNYVVPQQVFTYVTSLGAEGAIWTWGMILVAHMAYRRRVAAGQVQGVKYRMPGTPVTNWIGLAFLALVVVLLLFDPDTRVAFYVALAWFAILVIAYQFVRRRAGHGMGAEGPGRP
ncbi:proline-specific permease ProY [Kyrpidia spormannii]|uniref:Proline-specific permease ProY n=1 Tax=Kyrpidia spormannii TaxID=2055160 RepID=A0A2K8N9N4_9BACL|nr:amino acid permease [Kyrpidia spormannii]ATY86058.1 proline-specific permease ProY [Kyrpidia spormannii]